MGWLEDTLKKYEPLTWGITAVGLPLYAIEMARLGRLVNDKIGGGLNNICGVPFDGSKDVARFKKYYKEVTAPPKLPLSQSVKRFLSRQWPALQKLKHPWRLKGELKALARSIGPKVGVSLFIQEALYWIGGGGLEISLAFLAGHLGLDFEDVLAITVPSGFAGAQIRRVWLFWYLKNQHDVFQVPNEFICNLAREFKYGSAHSPSLALSRAVNYNTVPIVGPSTWEDTIRRYRESDPLIPPMDVLLERIKWAAILAVGSIMAVATGPKFAPQFSTGGISAALPLSSEEPNLL